MDILGCLNKSICRDLYRGLYPNKTSPKRECTLKLAAVYEIRRINSYETIDRNSEQVLWNAIHGAKRQKLQQYNIDQHNNVQDQNNNNNDQNNNDLDTNNKEEEINEEQN